MHCLIQTQCDDNAVRIYHPNSKEPVQEFSKSGYI
uniref:Uncharacterized protein n=1 Tax=Arundo donax TaxID=35708 RepID=A0A0A9FNP9_ARUDO